MTSLLISLAFGAFVAVMVWQLWHVFHVVPGENRQFMDRPPVGFRMVWPLIQALVHHCGEYFPQTQLNAAEQRLKRSGVEFVVSSQQFIAAKYVAAIVFGVVMAFVLSRFSHSVAVFALLGSVGGWFYPELWLREAGTRRQNAIVKQLPFYLDIITLSVEAGSNLTGGITQAVQKSSESPLRSELSRVLRDIRAGKPRATALRDLVERTGSQAVQNLVSTLIQAEKTGSSLGPLLRAQAEQLRAERFQRAEKLAMEAPVKMLGPLVMFIFPCTFMVLGFLILSKTIREGLVTWGPLLWAYNWPGG
jgi:tight adherence protein C